MRSITSNNGMKGITKDKFSMSIDFELLKEVDRRRGDVSRSRFISNILSKQLGGRK